MNLLKKTALLDNEWMLYFDYTTGEILFCFEGESDNVEGDIYEDEFIGKHIASIHNHTRNHFSAPSWNNFQILNIEKEDYEIITGYKEYWVVTAKGTFDDWVGKNIHEKLVEKYNAINDDIDYEKIEFLGDCIENSIYGNELSIYLNTMNVNITIKKGDYLYE